MTDLTPLLREAADTEDCQAEGCPCRSFISRTPILFEAIESVEVSGTRSVLRPDFAAERTRPSEAQVQHAMVEAAARVLARVGKANALTEKGWANVSNDEAIEAFKRDARSTAVRDGGRR